MLKDDVIKLLVTTYSFEMDEAEETVENSMSNSPDIWNENAEAEDLAKFLASDENDD